MGRNIKDQKRNSGLNMIIVIIDFELEDYECEPILDGRTLDHITEEQFKEWLSAMDTKWLPNEDVEIYFVDVKDKTWNKFKTKNSKRVRLDLNGLMNLINKSSLLILIKGNSIRACTYYPRDD